MVVVGGATRLTDSGLSITEWKPLLGAIPPLSQSDWMEVFDKYKQIPEYHLVNKGMSLEEFKFIFWWEWGHRFLGRIIGLVYAFPFFYFLTRGYLTKGLIILLSGIFILGGIQGYMGWFMVSSGLVERVDVSHYRLAAHLFIAALILAACIWVAARLRMHQKSSFSFSKGSVFVTTLIILCLVQIILGALVAGQDAGMVYNSWPLMAGEILPFHLVETSSVNAFFSDHFTIQFIHRLMAYLLYVAVLIYTLWRMRMGVFIGVSAAIFCIINLQMLIGIMTVIHVVPLDLALLHQFGAFLLLATIVGHRASFYKA